MEASSSSPSLPPPRPHPLPEEGIPNPNKAEGSPEKTKNGMKVKTTETELSALKRTGAVFATGLKFLRTGASLFSFSPVVVKGSWKGVRRSAKEVWNGKRKKKTRTFKHVISNGETLRALQAKEAKIKKSNELFDDLASAKGPTEAGEIARRYPEYLLPTDDALAVQAKRTFDWAERLEKERGITPPDAVVRNRQENAAKYAEIEEHHPQITPFEQALDKVDTVVRPAAKRFAWKRTEDPGRGLPADVRRVKQGVKEVRNQAHLDAKKSLREYNTLITKANYAERQSRWDTATGAKKSGDANDPSKKFDPYVRESIQYYVKNVPGIREQLREDNGHHYLVVPEKGGMIFMPNAKMEEINFIRFKEGNKIVKDPVKLQRYARCHTAAYNTINDKLNEWLKAHPELNLNRDQFTTYSYNFTTEMAYVQGPLDPNKPASKQPRKNIKLGSDVWDRIGKILDPEKTKKSDKLDSPRVYKHSRAEGEREERLARIAAEKEDLLKKLEDAAKGDKAAIQSRIDELEAEKLAIATTSTGKVRDTRLDSLSDESHSSEGNASQIAELQIQIDELREQKATIEVSDPRKSHRRKSIKEKIQGLKNEIATLNGRGKEEAKKDI